MRRCATLEIVRLLQGHTQTLCLHHHRNPSGNQSLQLTMDPTPDQPTATVSLGGDCACGCVCVCRNLCKKQWVSEGWLQACCKLSVLAGSFPALLYGWHAAPLFIRYMSGCGRTKSQEECVCFAFVCHDRKNDYRGDYSGYVRKNGQKKYKKIHRFLQHLFCWFPCSMWFKRLKLTTDQTHLDVFSRVLRTSLICSFPKYTTVRCTWPSWRTQTSLYTKDGTLGMKALCKLSGDSKGLTGRRKIKVT